MDRDAIRNAVRKYIINDNSKYALLIDGTWGIGKTYLFENYLLDDIYDIEIGKNNGRILVYVSLYGISSIEELSKQLLTECLIKCKCHDEFSKQKVKKLSGWINVLSYAISFSCGPVSADLGCFIDVAGEQINPQNNDYML